MGFAEGMPRLLLRLEGAAVLAASLAAYGSTGASWWWFLLFLAPDISFVGYVLGTQRGAAGYNALHTYTVPILLGLAGWWFAVPVALALALVWTAHIGFDRMLGYGLKYPDSFGATHLGRVGKDAKR